MWIKREFHNLFTRKFKWKNPKVLLLNVTFIIILSFCFMISSSIYHNYLLKQSYQNVKDDLYLKGNLMSNSIEKNYTLLYALEGYVQDQLLHNESFSNYNIFASGIYKSMDGIYNVNIAPRGIAQYIYPLKENVAMIGHSIINNDNSEVRVDVQRAMMTLEPVASGPFQREGGQELVLRKAILYNGQFWGLASVVLDMMNIYNDAGILNNNSHIDYAIRNSKNIFYGSDKVFSSDPVTYLVELQYNSFEIGATPINGWEASIQKDLNFFKIINLVILALLLIILNMIIYQGIKINKKVIEKTGELNIANLLLEDELLRREELEMSLRESERSKTALLANLPGMAYRCYFDRDWTMEFVSDGCFELTGYSKDALIMNKELTFNDIIRQEDQKFLWEKWDVVLSEKQVFTEEYKITTATGEVKWVWEQGQGVYDENGNVLAIEGFITDISDRKKREDEIVYLSYHDMMTGLYNRRYFEEMIEQLDIEGKLPLSVIIADINGLKLINDTFGHAEGDKLLIKTAEILKSMCRKKDVLARTGGDEFCILMPKTSYEEVSFIKRSIVDLLEEHKADKEKDPFFTGIALGYSTKTSPAESLDSVIKEAEDFMYRRKLLQNKSLHSSLINSIKTTLFEKSLETENHAERLTVLSRQLGEKMDLQDEQLTELELLSTLHDIGKIVINDDILNKPSALNEQERKEMMKHSEIGYRIAKASPELEIIAEYILAHHERWDGKGYPQGLTGEEIPLLSRILAVVDAYDAMTQDRPYRKAMSNEYALTELKQNAGMQFDPTIVKDFLELLNN